MAEIFKAKSYGVEGFEKIIAIKRILPSMGEDRDFIKMFIDEAKIVGQLAHANICQIFELGRIDGHHFIAMEYIWGKDLLQVHNRLRKMGRVMDVPMACYIMAKVCEGLDYAHKKRDAMGAPLEIVHRDCSPQNVLASYEGEVKLIDFGIAKAASRSSRTMAGVLKGKFGYMSPEQVRGLPLDRRSDIFALGTIFYESLVGGRLFQGESDFSTLEKVRNVDIHPPRAENENIPEEIERIVMKALAPNPEDRYQWCSEMHADLQAYLMSQERVFTAKMLGAWLKQAFAQELARERKLMESYKQVGRDGRLAAGTESDLERTDDMDDASVEDETMLGGPSFEEIIASTASSGRGRGRMPARSASGDFDDAPTRLDTTADDDDDDDGEDFAEEAPTEIFGDDPRHDLLDLGAVGRSAVAGPRQAAGAASASASRQHRIAEARTQIAQDAPDEVKGQIEGFNRSLPLSPPAADYSTPFDRQSASGTRPGPPGVRVDSGYQAPVSGPASTPPAPAAPPSGSYRGEQAAPRGDGGFQPPFPGPSSSGGYYGPPGGPQPGAPMRPEDMYFGATSSVRPLPIPGGVEPGGTTRQRGSSLLKDISIGVGIALFVIGIFAAVKFLYLDRQMAAEEVKPALLLVGVDEGPPAEVKIDDVGVAVINGGEELRHSLDYGEYKVEVVRDGVPACVNAVVLTESEREARLRCQTMPTPRSKPMGALVLDGLADGDSVSVDGAVVTAPREPLMLTAGEEHEVVVTRAGGAQPATFRVTVEPGGQTRRDMALRDADAGSPHRGGDDGGGDGKDDGGGGGGDEPAGSGGAAQTDDDDAGEDRRAPDSRRRPGERRRSADDRSRSAGKGFLRANSTPPARILIDGRDTGKRTSPRTKIALEPGRYSVTLVVDGKQHSFPVTIEDGQDTLLIKDLSAQ